MKRFFVHKTVAILLSLGVFIGTAGCGAPALSVSAEAVPEEAEPAGADSAAVDPEAERFALNRYLSNFAETYMPDPDAKEIELDTENIDVTAFLNFAYWHNAQIVRNSLSSGYVEDSVNHSEGWPLEELNAALEALFGITISEKDAERYEDQRDGDWTAVYEDGRLKVMLAPEIYLPQYAIAQDVQEVDEDRLEITFYSYRITMEQYDLVGGWPQYGQIISKSVAEADRSTQLDRFARGTAVLRRDGDGYLAEYVKWDYRVYDVEFERLSISYDTATGHAEYTFSPYDAAHAQDPVYKTEEYGGEFPEWLEGEYFDMVLRPGEEPAEDEYRVEDVQLEGALLKGIDRDGNTAWEEVIYARDMVGQFTSVFDIGMYGDVYYIGSSGNLIALDVRTGEELWENPDIGSGAGNCVVDSEGNVYVLGADGPDICVVNREGETVCCIGELFEEYYWPYLAGFDERNHVLYIGLDGGPEDEYTVPIARYGSNGHVVKFDTETFEYELDPEYRDPMSVEEAQELCGAAEVRAVSVEASSTLQGGPYGAENVLDGRADTAWVEGADGLGEGEYLDFHFPAGAVVRYIELVNGYAKDSNTFYKNAAPSGIRLISGCDEVALELDTYYEGRTFYVLPGELGIDQTIRLKIEAVTEGSDYEDTCISEVRFWGEMP